MAYEFRSGRSVREEVPRLLAEELDGAIAELRGQREAERVKAVHAARKHLKKARSLLRLVRGPLGEKVYARENGRLRDAGLRLSDVRDAQVAVATLDTLSQRIGTDLPSAAVGDVRDVLVSRRAAATEQAGGDADLVAEVLAALQASRDRVERLRLDRRGWAALEGGLALAYDRGEQASRRAERKPTLDALHEWRKRVKDSWYHLRLLTPVWPEVVQPLSEQAHRLSELLGDDHDLGVLRAALAGKGGPFDGAAELDVLIAQVDRRRAELQREAFRLGRRFYAESTRAYGRRLAAYWETWRDEAPEATPAPKAKAAPGAQAAPGAGRRGPSVLAEPRLPRPALGSVERAPEAPRPAAVSEPQLAAPALGSVERAGFTPAPPSRPAAPVLPAPALGSHEPAATDTPAPARTVAGSDTPAPPRAAARKAAAPARSRSRAAAGAPAHADVAEAPRAGTAVRRNAAEAGRDGNGAAKAVRLPEGVAVPARTTGKRAAAKATPSGAAQARPLADGEPEVGPAAGATASTDAAPTAAAPAPRRRAPATPRSRTTAAAASAQPEVVATLSGRRYHRPDCTLAGPSARPLTRGEAVTAGLSPCASCRP